MDLREELFSNTLDLPIYKKYKELHTSSKIKTLYFDDPKDKYLNYGFSNLTTLQKLGDSYYFLVSLTALKKERIKNRNDFFINKHPVINGFFTSLVGSQDSIAHEINILFCNGKLNKKIDFNSIPRKIKKRLNQSEGSGNIAGLQMVKTKVEKIRAEEWYKQIIAYRNGLVHSHVIFVAFHPDNGDPYLIRANLPPQEVFKKVWPGTERLEEKDFYYYDLTVDQECKLYFNAVKKSVKEFWQMFFDILKSPLPFPYPK